MAVDAGSVPETPPELMGGAGATSRTIFTGTRTYNRWLLIALRLALVVALLAIWQFGSGHLFNGFFFSKPTKIASELGNLIDSGVLGTNALVTIKEAALGYVIGIAAGIAAGFFCGRLRIVGEVIDPLLVAVFSIPQIALVPLIVLWFGIGTTPKVVMASLLVFYNLFFITYGAVRNVDRNLLNVVRVMGGTRRDELREVVIPSSLGAVTAGLRMAVPYAVLGAVGGEILAGSAGLGFLVNSSTDQFQVSETFAVLFVLALLGLVVNRLVALTGRRMQKWNPEGGG